MTSSSYGTIENEALRAKDDAYPSLFKNDGTTSTANHESSLCPPSSPTDETTVILNSGEEGKDNDDLILSNDGAGGAPSACNGRRGSSRFHVVTMGMMLVVVALTGFMRGGVGSAGSPMTASTLERTVTNYLYSDTPLPVGAECIRDEPFWYDDASKLCANCDTDGFWFDNYWPSDSKYYYLAFLAAHSTDGGQTWYCGPPAPEDYYKPSTLKCVGSEEECINCWKLCCSNGPHDNGGFCY